MQILNDIKITMPVEFIMMPKPGSMAEKTLGPNTLYYLLFWKAPDVKGCLNILISLVLELLLLYVLLES